MRVSKWGNSLAVRLPATVVDALGLKESDQIARHARTVGETAQVPGQVARNV